MPMQFTRTIQREVAVRSGDPALNDTDWIIRMHEHGINVRRKGEAVDKMLFLSWRSIIGTALIFKGRKDL